MNQETTDRAAMTPARVRIYDTTLRDGTQREGISGARRRVNVA